MANSAIEMQDNIKALTRRLVKRVTELTKKVKFGIYRGVDDFRTWFTKEQLSGRKGPGYGLKRQSGRAYSRWLIHARQLQRIYSVKLQSRAFNKGFNYLLKHQYGGFIRAKNPTGYLTFKIGDKWVRTRQVYIPKRITFYETFIKKWGWHFIEQNVRQGTNGIVHGAR